MKKYIFDSELNPHEVSSRKTPLEVIMDRTEEDFVNLSESMKSIEMFYTAKEQHDVQAGDLDDVFTFIFKNSRLTAEGDKTMIRFPKLILKSEVHPPEGETYDGNYSEDFFGFYDTENDQFVLGDIPERLRNAANDILPYVVLEEKGENPVVFVSSIENEFPVYVKYDLLDYLLEQAGQSIEESEIPEGVKIRYL